MASGIDGFWNSAETRCTALDRGPGRWIETLGAGSRPTALDRGPRTWIEDLDPVPWTLKPWPAANIQNQDKKKTKQSCNEVTDTPEKSIRKRCWLRTTKIMQNMKTAVWRLLQFIKNPQKWCLGAFRKGFWKNVRTSVSASDSILINFGVTWVILENFGEPSKSRGVPKTTQKIKCGYFLAPKGDWKA